LYARIGSSSRTLNAMPAMPDAATEAAGWIMLRRIAAPGQSGGSGRGLDGRMNGSAVRYASWLGGSRVFVAAMLVTGAQATSAADVAALAPGGSRVESVAPGKERIGTVSLDQGQSATLTLRQNDPGAIELRWNAAGAAPRALRTEAGRSAALRVPLVADARTTWTITVVAAKPAAARYTISLTTARAASAADRDLAASAAALADAEALRAKGDKAVADEARSRYAQAIEAARRGGDACAVRHAYVALSGFAHDIVDAEAQKAAADAALAEPCSEGVADRALAERLSGSASINQGDFATGARETERAVASFRETGDVHEEGIALRNLGLAYTESGETGKGLATTRAALKAAEATGDAHLLALVRNDLAFVYNARGEFALAIDAYRQTLDALKANPYPMAEAVAWINLGIAYAQLGDGDEAMAAYAKGERVAASVDCWSCLAEIDVDRGDDLLDGGDAAAARAAYQRALDVASAHDLVRQRAEALRGLGRCAMAASEWTQARTLLESAREDLHRTGGRVNESVAWALLGDLENRLGHADAARRNYAEALTLAREADNQAWQAIAHASLARVAESSGDLDIARREIDEALALIESERTHIGAPDLRTSYFGTKRAYYALDVDILMRLDRAKPGAGYAAEALAAAERARARELQDQLAGRAINVDRDVDPALLAAERDAADRLHALAYQLSQLGEHDDAKRSVLLTQIDEASRALDAARGSIRAANPRYAELTHPEAPTSEEIRNDLLDARVVVAEYWLGDERSYLWIVSRDALQAFELPSRATVEKQARALREKILAPAGIAPSVPIEQRAADETAGIEAVRAAASSLAATILPKEARALLGRDVAVVADGGLLTLPFAVLDDEAAPRAYVYLPSLGALRGLRALPRSPAPEKAVAIIADPVFRADDERLGGRVAKIASTKSAAPDDALVLRAAADVGIADLPRLPRTRNEADAIAALADRSASWVALDFAANRAAAVGADWSRYGIAHFATHALVNERHPELSGIVLSLYDAKGRAEDGFLRANDIYNLHLPASLVVLSVCESAVGKSVGGEGPANLARAFFYAGTPRVVASLWPVDDRASVAFMRAFYAALLEKNRRPQEALTDAARALRENPRWRAPYYWSGYVLEGDWR
jgi:CHAT domain-containing protein